MILAIAAVLGITVGMIHAFVKKRKLVIPKISAEWLIPVAVIPQTVCFFLPVTRTRIPDTIVSIILVTSQLILCVFAWLNRKQPGFWALGLGVILNGLVIFTNGGWMPISPETLVRLNPNVSQTTWLTGQRLGFSKDIVLPYSSMNFPLLADRIVFPFMNVNHLAYSLGDIFIAYGAFLLLLSVGNHKPLGHQYEVYV